MTRSVLRRWFPAGAVAAFLALVALVAAVTISSRTPAQTTSGAGPADAGAAAGLNAASSTVGANLDALVARGAYLAKAADCAGCHTAAPSPATELGHATAPTPFAGGLGMASPFGTIYSSNITPDRNAGIGRYTFDDFDRALREGIAPGGKRLYPAMPYPSFAEISDDDMRALYAYFMHGVPPASNSAPATHLPFPFDQRWALAAWDWLLAPSGHYEPNPSHDAQWNRGAYLVQSLGHCGACHTPRGPAYDELGYTQNSPLYLTGGTNDHWFAPNLTGDAGSGLGRIDPRDVAAFLKEGHGGGLVTFGSMVQVVEDSTQYMSDEDLAAIAAYLKSLPARQPSGHFDNDPRALQQTADAVATGNVERPGAGLYESMCARCHQSDGGGVLMKYPRLAGNPAVLAPHTDSLVRLLVEGGRSPATGDGPLPRKMPAFAGKLNDTEMGRVLTYIRSAWGNDAAPVTRRDVAQLRAAIHK